MSDFAAARTAMVDCQVRPSDVTRYPIISAMLSVPREEFVPSDMRSVAYAGEDISLSADRSILAPRTFAKMLDALALSGNELVLDIGAGYGYSTAVIAHMAQAVIGLEEVESLATAATTALSAAGADNAVIETGPLAEGAAAHGPYDAMVVQGAVEELPQAIVDQLRPDGRIVMLKAEGALCYAVLGVKGARGVSWRRIFDATAPVLPGFSKAPTFVF
ncbi:protein-L-isoaspartate(D-aspartate) O-methyltransferase [Rubricella aquisinus]|uniref:Protein-L-isoaspartate O-methyltransferase n=1 Tax=Rubricella aquisinus TaxID=2028108 RepID=A0A840WYF6_9RHOB|nr:protein-L-isoaspartate O-methyltransferase [Rubricella aquisinus]MBB5515414.1 protein-L-isoaspartate(D-aspartate) O-methyltransferase [Rubricella aquisinus]